MPLTAIGVLRHTIQSAQQVEAEKASQVSLICSILGLFFFGIVLGPIAILRGCNKAEKLGKTATAGRALGWTDAILRVIGLTVFGIMVGGLIAASSASY